MEEIAAEEEWEALVALAYARNVVIANRMGEMCHALR